MTSHDAFEAIHARRASLEKLLGATRGNPEDSDARARLLADLAVVERQTRELKQAHKRRHFAGLGSALHEALGARFDATALAQLEQEAMRRHAAREQRNAARRAARRVSRLAAELATATETLRELSEQIRE